MKPRSPGQRQFNPMGTPRDWQKVAQSPHVQRMLQDPQLAGALYQNFRQTGGSVPELQSAGMADGGLALDEADYMNEIAQELNDPNTAPSRKQALRNKLAQMGRAPRVSMPEPIERARGGAMRFADGGQAAQTLEELQQELADANAEYQQASSNQDFKGMAKATQKQAQIQQRISRVNMAESAPSPPPATGGQQAPAGAQSSTTGAAGSSSQGFSLGPNMNVSGSTMDNLKKLTGPMTPGNEAASILGGAMLGGGSSGSGAGALIGGATAGLLNYFIRKHNQQQQQNAQKQMQSPANGAQNYNASTNAVADNPGISNAGGAPASAASNSSSGNPPAVSSKVQNGKLITTFADGSTETKDAKPGDESSSSSASSPPSGAGLWSGTYPGGNATSNNGQDWTDVKTGKPISDPVINQTQIGSFGGDQAQLSPMMTPSPAQEAIAAGPLAPTSSDLSMIDPQFSLDAGLGGLAKGGPVKKAHGIAAIPVLHVMIAAIPKGKKKAMGGDIPQSERKPLKPKAVPPERGPHNGYLLPHGRVQVPRGSGAAIKGKRFGGIY